MRKNETKHPYLRGYIFWAPILAEWIASPSYTEKAKEQFRESLAELVKSTNLTEFEQNAAWK